MIVWIVIGVIVIPWLITEIRDGRRMSRIEDETDALIAEYERRHETH